jgi:hypothetical protein
MKLTNIAQYVFIILAICFDSSVLAQPTELSALRVTYNAALEKAAAPVREIYIRELQKLKKTYEAGNRTEDAVAIDQELQLLTAKPGGTPDSGTPEVLRAVLLRGGSKLAKGFVGVVMLDLPAEIRIADSDQQPIVSELFPDGGAELISHTHFTDGLHGVQACIMSSRYDAGRVLVASCFNTEEETAFPLISPQQPPPVVTKTDKRYNQAGIGPNTGHDYWNPNKGDGKPQTNSPLAFDIKRAGSFPFSRLTTFGRSFTRFAFVYTERGKSRVEQLITTSR